MRSTSLKLNYETYYIIPKQCRVPTDGPPRTTDCRALL